MIIGVHARNESPLHQEDNSSLTALQGATLVFHYQNPDDLIQHGVIPGNSVVRLPDSVYKKQDGTDYVPSYVTYSTDCTRIIRYFSQRGFKRYVLDNEPNRTWPTLWKSPGVKLGAWDWSLFILNAMTDNIVGIIHNMPAGTELLFTPMSQPMQDIEWINASKARGLIDLFYGVAAHCYWQAAGDLYSIIFGAGFEWLHEKTGKNIYITESANSKIQSPHPLPLETIRILQQQQYPAYTKFCNNFNYVKGLYFYILGGTQEWEGFYLTPPIINAITLVANTLPTNIGNGIKEV